MSAYSPYGISSSAPIVNIGATRLSGLDDVGISSASNGQALVYDSATGLWRNGNVSAGGVSTLAALTDVNLIATADRNYLRYDSATSRWINSPDPMAIFHTSGAQEGHILRYNTIAGKFVTGNHLGNAVFTNDSIGILADTDLLSMAPNHLTINGNLNLTGNVTNTLNLANGVISSAVSPLDFNLPTGNTEARFNFQSATSGLNLRNGTTSFLTSTPTTTTLGSTSTAINGGLSVINPLVGNTTFRLGSATTASTFTIQNTALTTLFQVRGDGSIVGLPLSKLSDATITSPTNNQVLTWNSSTSRWINQTIPGSSGSWTISASGECTSTNNIDFKNNQWRVMDASGASHLQMNQGTGMTIFGTKRLAFGDSDQFRIKRDGDNSIEATNGNIRIETLDNNSHVIAKLGASSTSSAFRIQNNSGTDVFRVNGDGSLDGVTVAKLDDVSISSIANNQVLQWVSANSRWENKTLSSAEDARFDTSGPQGGHLLRYDGTLGKYTTQNVLGDIAFSANTISASGYSPSIYLTPTGAEIRNVLQVLNPSLAVGGQIEIKHESGNGSIDNTRGSLTVTNSQAGNDMNLKANAIHFKNDSDTVIASARLGYFNTEAGFSCGNLDQLQISRKSTHSEILNILNDLRIENTATNGHVVVKLGSSSNANSFKIRTNLNSDVFEFRADGTTNMNLDTLNDVTISSVSNGQVLTFNSSSGHWENSTPSAGSGTGSWLFSGAQAGISARPKLIELTSGVINFYKSLYIYNDSNALKANLQGYDDYASLQLLSTSTSYFYVGEGGLETTIKNLCRWNTTANSGSTSAYKWDVSGTQVMLIRADSTMAGNFASASDERDKKDISPLPLGLDFINQLSPKRFKMDERVKYLDDKENYPQFQTIDQVVTDGSKQEAECSFGFLAQDILQVLPQACNTKLIQSQQDGSRYLMNYEQLIAPMVNAIKELSQKINQLEAQLASITTPN